MAENRRWGVSLSGEPFDLLDWLEGLRPPFDPHLERRSVIGKEEFVLFCEAFDNAVDASDVRQRALPLIAEISGALAITRRSRPLRLKNVIEFGEGDPMVHAFAEGQGFTVRCRLSATGSVTVDGKPLPPLPPTPSAPQQWLEVAQKSDHAADLLAYASSADDWFNIYKMIEAASALVGGEHQLVKLCGPQVKDAKECANEARHHRVNRSAKPLTLDEARATAFHAASTALERFRNS